MNRTAVRWTVVVLLLLWLPMPPSPTTAAWGWDLLVHFGLFWILGVLSWPEGTRRRTHRTLRLLALPILIATVGEAGQLYIPGRDFQFLDLWVNLTGLVAGALYAHLEPKTREGVQLRGTIVGLLTIALGVWGVLLLDSMTSLFLSRRGSLLYGTGLVFGLTTLIWTGRYRDVTGAVLALVGTFLFALLSPPWHSPGPVLTGSLLIAAALRLLRTENQHARFLVEFLLLPAMGVWWLALILPVDRFLYQLGGWILLGLLGGYLVGTITNTVIQTSGAIDFP